MKKLFMFAAVGMLVASCSNKSQEIKDAINDVMSDNDIDMVDELSVENMNEEPVEEIATVELDPSKYLVPESTTVEGPLGDYFTVVMDNYECDWGRVKLKFVRNSNPFTFPTANAGRFPGYDVEIPDNVDTFIGFGLTILDPESDKFKGTRPNTSSSFVKDLTSVIINAKAGEVIEVPVFIGAIYDSEAGKFQVTSSVEDR